MKTNKLFAIIAMAAMWGAVACDDAKNVPIRGESDSDNRLYITEASVGSSKDIAMPKSGPAHIQITVRMIRPADHDVKVLLVADPTVLDEYNLEFATNYQLIEAVNYTVPNEVVIPAGSSSASVPIIVQNFDISAGNFALPIRLHSDGIRTTKSSSALLLPIVKEMKQYVCSLPNTNYGLLDLSFDLPNYTLEWWVRSDGFPTNDQCLIDAGSGSGDGDTELYIRFGDANPTPYSYLQVKTMGGPDMNSNDPATAPLSVNVWYHFAVAYDGTTGISSLYMNGKKVVDSASKYGPGKPMHFSRFTLGNGSVQARIELAQVRLWKTTRTEAQLLKYMKTAPAPNDPDLEMYYPMDEGSDGGGFFQDVTGNHDGLPIRGTWSQEEVNFSQL